MSNEFAEGFAEGLAVHQSAALLFGVNVRALRESRGMSQESLAFLMSARGFSFHQTTAQRIESGKRKTSIGEAVALAALFSVSVNDLISPLLAEIVESRIFRSRPPIDFAKLTMIGGFVIREDVEQRYPLNPILAVMRQSEFVYRAALRGVQFWSADFATRRQVEHAEKVIARLRALQTSTNGVEDE